MAVRRIVTNIHADRLEDAKRFYGDILDMELVMDHGWIVTYASDSAMKPQVSLACEGGSGTPVPDLSIEVDNFDEVYRRASASGIPIQYGPATEPWGVRRFFARDPFGRLVNILTHD
ncbi:MULTISPECIES: VOC family protein [Rhodopseudomonas]|uniref:VOC family protein n=1 Tax=Rhodopseudomonas telluris TaxID=644215 RepID=A0ABV6EUD7_9BRAD